MKRAAHPAPSESDIVELLRRRYVKDSGNGPSHVVIPQVRNAAGFDAKRTADAIGMDLWPSRGLHLKGFEIKRTRADVRKELAQPDKAEAFARWCEEWWLVVADQTHIRADELPPPWGLLIVSYDADGAPKGLRTAKAAPIRDVPKEIPKTFLAALLRQAVDEMARPGRLALRAEHDRGVERGRDEARTKLAELEQLRARVDAFKEATGLSIDVYDKRLTENAAVVRLLLGEFAWDGLVGKLRQLGDLAGQIGADVEAAGLADEITTPKPRRT